jgi:hypothetical protein
MQSTPLRQRAPTRTPQSSEERTRRRGLQRRLQRHRDTTTTSSSPSRARSQSVGPRSAVGRGRGRGPASALASVTAAVLARLRRGNVVWAARTRWTARIREDGHGRRKQQSVSNGFPPEALGRGTRLRSADSEPRAPPDQGPGPLRRCCSRPWSACELADRGIPIRVRARARCGIIVLAAERGTQLLAA